MKTLFLIRHAKSSGDDTALPDKDRPLSDRGRRDAPKMGKRYGCVPNAGNRAGHRSFCGSSLLAHRLSMTHMYGLPDETRLSVAPVTPYDADALLPVVATVSRLLAAVFPSSRAGKARQSAQHGAREAPPYLGLLAIADCLNPQFAQRL